MRTIIYWFRNDLRIDDNPAFLKACANADYLIPIYIHDERERAATKWGFKRFSEHRERFLSESLKDLRQQLRSKNSDLIQISGNFEVIAQRLKEQFITHEIFAEEIYAPEEKAQDTLLRRLGFEVDLTWQSSMLDPRDLPFELVNLPDVFTAFRQKVEQSGLSYTKPVDSPRVIPPLPHALANSDHVINQTQKIDQFEGSPFVGGFTSAGAHLKQYFERRLPDTYKKTRNQLIGLDYSTKFSPWLANGSYSIRRIAWQLKDYESQYGANEGTYWIWFELLWRDYFRFLHFKYFLQLYREEGLRPQSTNNLVVNEFDFAVWEKWISSNTKEALIDAGMRELRESGYLSNRMRQILASYWIYQLRGSWQAGAAWFEAQLIDFDVYSNQGNWLYIAGRGTDPRGGRIFNLQKQIRDYDPDGLYQKMWSAR